MLNPVKALGFATHAHKFTTRMHKFLAYLGNMSIVVAGHISPNWLCGKTMSGHASSNDGVGNLIENAAFSTFLDWSRGIAALMVCLAHTRNLLFPNFQEVGDLNIFAKAFYFFTLFGEQAVVVFFVISGFLIGGNIARHFHERKPFEYAPYIFARLARIGVVLYPAIILAVVFQFAGMAQTCPTQDAMTTVLGNMLFLHNFVTEPLCNDHPLWSLSNEMFYYVTAPLLFYLAYNKKRVILFISLAAIASLALLDSTHRNIPFGYLIWFIGIFPVFVKINLHWSIGFFLFLAALGLSRFYMFGNEYAWDVILALGYLCTILSRFPESPPNRVLASVGKSFASFSYSLYLVQMPLAQFAAKLLNRQLDPNEGMSYLIFAVVIAVIGFVAYLSGLVFESRTKNVRQLLMIWFTKDRTV